MLIQIFTSSKQTDNGFMLYQQHFTDYVCLNRLKKEIQAESKLQADAFNVGFAMAKIVNEDRKFGIVHKEFTYKDVYRGKKEADSFKQWIEYKTGVKRYACVYTDNDEVFNNIRYSIRDVGVYMTKVFNRIIQLKTEFNIGLGLMRVDEITPKHVEAWKKSFKD